jgi:hypothetical protein
MFEVIAVLAGLAAFAPAHGVKPALPAELPLCERHEVHMRQLARTYGEVPVLKAAVGNRVSLQLFVNRTLGRWTMLVVSANGMSCIRNVGEVTVA